MIIHSPQELATYLSIQRKELKLTQSAVADLVGLKQKTISAFENRPEHITLKTFFFLLSALELDLEISKKNKATQKSQWKEEW